MDLKEKTDNKGLYTGIFAAGVLFGTAGIKLLSSRDAKKAYTKVTAAVLRAKNSLLKTATTIQENAEDIYEDAVQINKDIEESENKVYEDKAVSVEEAVKAAKEAAAEEGGR